MMGKSVRELVHEGHVPVGDSAMLLLQFNAATRLSIHHLALSDSELMQVPDMFEPWVPERQPYAVGDVFQHGVNLWEETQLWRVRQDHVSQADKKPDGSAALYVKVGVAPDGETPVWTKPLCSFDAYDYGDCTYHKDAYWVSDIEGKNTYEPGVYGWDEKP
jgi:hypothetical protein